jgi:hypothetical protein
VGLVQSPAVQLAVGEGGGSVEGAGTVSLGGPSTPARMHEVVVVGGTQGQESVPHPALDRLGVLVVEREGGELAARLEPGVDTQLVDGHDPQGSHDLVAGAEPGSQLTGNAGQLEQSSAGQVLGGGGALAVPPGVHVAGEEVVGAQRHHVAEAETKAGMAVARSQLDAGPAAGGVAQLAVLLRPHEGRPPRTGPLMTVPVGWAAP